MRVAVIGAGASGLVCGRELARAGLDYTVFESSPRIGGVWVYDQTLGPMYASLRTNLPTDLMAFRDFPFDGRGGGDDAWPRFVGHREVRLYLERFAAAFDIQPHIEFDRRVQRVERVGAGWVVHAPAPQRFEAVAICSGHYHRASPPDLPGLDAFEGRVLHSQHYRDPVPFAGRRVALLGAKSSGMDLSSELAGVASAVYLCACDSEALPPRDGVETRPPIAAALPGRSLELADGSRLDDVDDLVLCTGYDYAFEFLPPEPGYLTLERKWIHPLWLDVVAIEAPSLGFIGLPFQVVPFPLMELQARVFAHLLAGRIVLPHRDQMRADHQREVRRLQEAGVQRRHFFRYGDRQFDYCDALARRVGSPPLPAWYRPLYEETTAAKRADPDGYRDATLSVASA